MLKKLIIGCIVISILSSCSSNNYSNYKYKITIPCGRYTCVDYMNDYTIENNCLHCVDKDGDRMTFCGTYILTERHN